MGSVIQIMTHDLRTVKKVQELTCFLIIFDFFPFNLKFFFCFPYLFCPKSISNILGIYCVAEARMDSCCAVIFC